MISYEDNTLTITIDRDRFGFGLPMAAAFAHSVSPQVDRGLQVKSVVNPKIACATTGDTTPGNHAWRPPDW